MNNPTIKDFIIKGGDILTKGHIRFLKDLVDDHKSFHYDYGGTRDKPLDGKIWQPRADTVRKDSQFLIDPFWPQLAQEINIRLYQRLLAPYMEEYSTLGTYSNQYLNGTILVQKTEPGEGYHSWHDENGEWKYYMRSFAWMIYLNDVEEGGETEFLYQKTRFKPKANTGLLWPGGFTHTHRGNPPLSGTKYILTGWITPVGEDVADIRMVPPLDSNGKE